MPKAAQRLSPSLSTCLFLSQLCLIKIWCLEWLILSGTICCSLSLAWAKDGNIGTISLTEWDR